MYYLYILKSLKDLGYYIGITDNINERLKQHNKGKTKSTRKRTPFILCYSESCTSKTEARKREIHLKKNYQARKELLIELGFKITALSSSG